MKPVGRGRVVTTAQRRDAAVLWDYHQLHHNLSPVDAAVGLGSHDLSVPAHAATLYHAGMFPRVVFTGAGNTVRPQQFPDGEAARFRDLALAAGVPDAAILVEPEATNTAENLTLSRAVLTAAGVAVDTVMLIAMPYMQRRAYATCRKVWPQVHVTCASAATTFDDYVTTIDDEALVVAMLVGDLQRIIIYPQRGFAIAQDIPAPVRAAYDRLVADGFTSRLIPA